MTEPQIEAAYGPIHSQYRTSRRGVAVQLALAPLVFVIGAALATFAFVFLRVPYERTMEQAGLVFVGAFLALGLAPALVFVTLRSLGDRLELRALGLVRRSKQFGLKHLRYTEITRIEQRMRGGTSRGLDVFASDGRLIGVGSFERDTEEMARDLERRANVTREAIAI